MVPGVARSHALWPVYVELAVPRPCFGCVPSCASGL